MTIGTNTAGRCQSVIMSRRLPSLQCTGRRASQPADYGAVSFRFEATRNRRPCPAAGLSRYVASEGADFLVELLRTLVHRQADVDEIGRASCRARVGQYG